uniref:VRR-NUC domain-containing protein n=1 Tax=Clostridium sp. NkU-1 TaxID=1095009 RepID=UPI0032601406
MRVCTRILNGFIIVRMAAADRKKEAARLKAQGVKAGVPDLHLPIPKGAYAGLYIEMKYNTGTVEDEQKEWIKAMKAAGHYACVCYGYDYAVKVIEEYVSLLPDQTMSHENGIILKDRKRGKEVVL